MNEKIGIAQLHHVIAAQAKGDRLFLVYLSYWEDDAANAVGQIITQPLAARLGSISCALNTNDSLTPTLWCSCESNLWVGSTNGNIWTTAPVSWPQHRMAGLIYNVQDPILPWTVTTLPNLRHDNHRPNVSALWGINDRNVFVGTFEGAIYRWDGHVWLQVLEEGAGAINHIHGSSEDDVYAVGNNDLILHFDGNTWRRLPYPGDTGTRDALTSVRALNRNEAFICGTGGRILHGSRNGFGVLGQWALPFYGIAYFQERLILVAGIKGVYELLGNQMQMLKDNFGAVAVFEANDRIVVIEPTQALASLIEYCPTADPPWSRRTYS